MTLRCGLAPAAAPRRAPAPATPPLPHALAADSARRLAAGISEAWRAGARAARARRGAADQKPEGWCGITRRRRGAAQFAARVTRDARTLRAPRHLRGAARGGVRASCLTAVLLSLVLRPPLLPVCRARVAPQAQNHAQFLIGAAGGSSKGSQPCLRE